MRVQFVTKQGVRQIREVPEGTEPERYQFGIVVGPPDLSELDLPKGKLEQLTELLVEQGFGDYQDTKGRRSELLTIIAKIYGTRDKNMLRYILYLYQKDFFEE